MELVEQNLFPDIVKARQSARLFLQALAYIAKPLRLAQQIFAKAVVLFVFALRCKSALVLFKVQVAPPQRKIFRLGAQVF